MIRDTLYGQTRLDFKNSFRQIVIFDTEKEYNYIKSKWNKSLGEYFYAGNSEITLQAYFNRNYGLLVEQSNNSLLDIDHFTYNNLEILYPGIINNTGWHLDNSTLSIKPIDNLISLSANNNLKSELKIFHQTQTDFLPVNNTNIQISGTVENYKLSWSPSTIKCLTLSSLTNSLDIMGHAIDKSKFSTIEFSLIRNYQLSEKYNNNSFVTYLWGQDPETASDQEIATEDENKSIPKIYNLYLTLKENFQKYYTLYWDYDISLARRFEILDKDGYYAQALNDYNIIYNNIDKCIYPVKYYENEILKEETIKWYEFDIAKHTLNTLIVPGQINILNETFNNTGYNNLMIAADSLNYCYQNGKGDYGFPINGTSLLLQTTERLRRCNFLEDINRFKKIAELLNKFNSIYDLFAAIFCLDTSKQFIHSSQYLYTEIPKEEIIDLPIILNGAPETTTIDKGYLWSGIWAGNTIDEKGKIIVNNDIGIISYTIPPEIILSNGLPYARTFEEQIIPGETPFTKNPEEKYVLRGKLLPYWAYKMLKHSYYFEQGGSS